MIEGDLRDRVLRVLEERKLGSHGECLWCRRLSFEGGWEAIEHEPDCKLVEVLRELKGLNIGWSKGVVELPSLRHPIRHTEQRARGQIVGLEELLTFQSDEGRTWFVRGVADGVVVVGPLRAAEDAGRFCVALPPCGLPLGTVVRFEFSETEDFSTIRKTIETRC